MAKGKPRKCKNLVIVESPAKAKTIGKFLGSEYHVESCLGHVRDLPKNKLGVDVEDEFRPTYVVIPGKKTTVSKLKKLGAGAEKVFLATDMDREGEAISWHLSQELGHEHQYRIVFNQVTRDALKDAIAHPGAIDQCKVDAQQGRRVLDRLVGYKLSPLLWNKVKRGLSAGRVQSVAVRLLCEREDEREAFVSAEYWTMSAVFVGSGEEKLEAVLQTINGRRQKIKTEHAVKQMAEGIRRASYNVSKVAKTQGKKSPSAPFTTSTLQQAASSNLRLTPVKTMRTAQELYEGQDIGAGEHVGLITYMRTDSTRVAKEAQQSARNWISAQFGEEFIPQRTPVYRSRKRSQDAHEAIRPTQVERHPDQMKKHLSADQFKLYDLIWRRFVASQMSHAVVDKVTVELKSQPEGGKTYMFRADGRQVSFDGFLKVYKESREKDKEIFVPRVNDTMAVERIVSKQSFTQAPPLYTEAALIKVLEEKGIGRPSTYAPIISTIQRRGYTKWVKGKLIPTSLARVVDNLLTENFADVVEADFTARMELGLDDVEQGKRCWTDLVRDFYGVFRQDLELAETRMKNVKEDGLQVSTKKCEHCGKNMIVKIGRFGQFLACSGYPECKNTKPLMAGIGVKCPAENCSGEIIERMTKTGKMFYACSRYPECTFRSWDEPVAATCPFCGSSYLVEGRSGGLKCPQCSKSVKKTITELVSTGDVPHEIVKVRIGPSATAA